MWGPPDEVDSHPTGGNWDRPMDQGGGSTTTYPYEDWRYRYLEGNGENVELEFVDPTSTGEYHLTMDPSEKDASAARAIGAGLTLAESMGMWRIRVPVSATQTAPTWRKGSSAEQA